MDSSNDIDKKSLTTDRREKLIDLADSATNRFRDRFENFLNRKVARQTPITKSSSEMGVPMVCTMLRGTLGTIEILYQKLQQEVPVIILKGTGSAADIIAYVYDEINAKSVLCVLFFLTCSVFLRFRNNKNYEDDNLKTELTRRLLDEYPALKDNNTKRNEIRDNIMAIVKKADQNKQKLLTFVDVNSSTVSLNDFHKFILSTYLQCTTFFFYSIY